MKQDKSKYSWPDYHIEINEVRRYRFQGYIIELYNLNLCYIMKSKVIRVE